MSSGTSSMVTTSPTIDGHGNGSQPTGTGTIAAAPSDVETKQPISHQQQQQQQPQQQPQRQPKGWKCPVFDHPENPRSAQKCGTAGCKYYRTDNGIGLACSGGGIRAAAFASGVLCRLLDAITDSDSLVLSAVSGGGYLASAFVESCRNHNLPLQDGSLPTRKTIGHDLFCRMEARAGYICDWYGTVRCCKGRRDGVDDEHRTVHHYQHHCCSCARGCQDTLWLLLVFLGWLIITAGTILPFACFVGMTFASMFRPTSLPLLGNMTNADDYSESDYNLAYILENDADLRDEILTKVYIALLVGVITAFVCFCVLILCNRAKEAKPISHRARTVLRLELQQMNTLKLVKRKSEPSDAVDVEQWNKLFNHPRIKPGEVAFAQKMGVNDAAIHLAYVMFRQDDSDHVYQIRATLVAGLEHTGVLLLCSSYVLPNDEDLSLFAVTDELEQRAKEVREKLIELRPEYIRLSFDEAWDTYLEDLVKPGCQLNHAEIRIVGQLFDVPSICIHTPNETKTIPKKKVMESLKERYPDFRDPPAVWLRPGISKHKEHELPQLLTFAMLSPSKPCHRLTSVNDSQPPYQYNKAAVHPPAIGIQLGAACQFIFSVAAAFTVLLLVALGAHIVQTQTLFPSSWRAGYLPTSETVTLIPFVILIPIRCCKLGNKLLNIGYMTVLFLMARITQWFVFGDPFLTLHHTRTAEQIVFWVAGVGLVLYPVLSIIKNSIFGYYYRTQLAAAFYHSPNKPCMFKDEQWATAKNTKYKANLCVNLWSVTPGAPSFGLITLETNASDVGVTFKRIDAPDVEWPPGAGSSLPVSEAMGISAAALAGTVGRYKKLADIAKVANVFGVGLGEWVLTTPDNSMCVTSTVASFMTANFLFFVGGFFLYYPAAFTTFAARPHPLVFLVFPLLIIGIGTLCICRSGGLQTMLLHPVVRFIIEFLGIVHVGHQAPIAMNVSDGGHYENLGLLPLLIDGKKLIIISDAGDDPEERCNDLWNALKIGREFGYKFSPSSIDDSERDLEAHFREVFLGVPNQFFYHFQYTGIDPYGNACSGEIVYCKIRNASPATDTCERNHPTKHSYDGHRHRDDRYGHDDATSKLSGACCHCCHSPSCINLCGLCARPFGQFPRHPTGNQFFTPKMFRAYHNAGKHALHQAQSCKHLQIREWLDKDKIGDQQPAVATAAPPPAASTSASVDHDHINQVQSVSTNVSNGHSGIRSNHAYASPQDARALLVVRPNTIGYSATASSSPSPSPSTPLVNTDRDRKRADASHVSDPSSLPLPLLSATSSSASPASSMQTVPGPTVRAGTLPLIAIAVPVTDPSVAASENI